MSNGKVASVRSGLGEPFAVDRAREVARQVAERQKEIAGGPRFGLTREQDAELGAALAKEPPGHIVVLEPAEPAFAPDQSELRQLLAVKLRSLAADLELGQFERKYPNAGQVRQRVARLGDIAGALE